MSVKKDESAVYGLQVGSSVGICVFYSLCFALKLHIHAGRQKQDDGTAF